MNRLCRAAAAAMLAVIPAAASPALACSQCPVDDFEAGSFDHQSATFQQFAVAIPGFPSHAAAATRLLTLEPNGGTVHARLTAGAQADDHAILTIPGTGRCRMQWDWGFPLDITQGGTNGWTVSAGAVDCVDLRVDGPAGTQVLLEIGDGSGSTSVARWLAESDGPQKITWDLFTFLQSQLVDITQATHLELTFDAPPSGGDLYVYDLRFGRAATGPADFQGTFTATQTPPVPTPPLIFELRDALTAQPIYEAQVAVAGLLTDASTVPAADWTWSQTQIPGNDVALMTFQQSDPEILEMDIDVSVNAAGLGGTPLVDLYPPDPVHTAESIALGFLAVTRDGTGLATGASTTWLTFDFDPQQLGSLEFQAVSVAANAKTQRVWTSGFTLSFRVAFSGMNTPDYNSPLFHATWTSDWSTQIPVGVAPEGTAVAEDALRLIAAPSITGAGTELRASRPFGRAATVLIHDVAGRRVRSLPAEAGARTVRWDGRDETGRAAAAGVYFVRLAGTGAATRVVKAGTGRAK